MTFATHRLRTLVLAVLFALLLLALFARRTSAGWSADPVEVHATTALCPLVSVSDDAQQGAIVVWQEATASGGLLKAQHLLASGDVDPAWNGPVAVCSHDASRSALGSIADASGGAYVWWMENAQLYLTRLESSGAVAAGWPSRGRALGTLFSSGHRPNALADGSGGVYLSWISLSSPLPPILPVVRAVHLGASNTGAGGWPSGVRTIGTSPGEQLTNSFGIGLASDGGLWVAWQTTTLQEPDHLPGELRVSRLTPAGLPASGWTVEGVPLATFHAEHLWSGSAWNPIPTSALVAVHGDGADGAFVLASALVDEGGDVYAAPALRRIDALGQPAAGWPAAGHPIQVWGFAATSDAGANASLRLLPDSQGGVFAGVPGFGSEFSAVMSFQHRGGDGAHLGGGTSADQRGVEFAAGGDGRMWISSYKPSGATGPFEADAYVGVWQSDPGPGWYESEGSFYSTRYGDVGLAATGGAPTEGGSGAIFAWSQLIDRQGVYAIRMNPGGAVTGVPPAAAITGLRAWFVRGEGVRARASLAGEGALELRLLDLTGREVARASAAAGADGLLPDTAALPSGVYFARATRGPRTLDARVVVVR
jgi:hypothetical protein